MNTRLVIVFAILAIISLTAVYSTTIVIDENDVVDLFATGAVQEEEGVMTDYSFAGPFDEKGQWQTTEGDYGTYKIKVKVTDDDGNVKIEELTLIINKKPSAEPQEELPRQQITANVVKIDEQATEQPPAEEQAEEETPVEEQPAEEVSTTQTEQSVEQPPTTEPIKETHDDDIILEEPNKPTSTTTRLSDSIDESEYDVLLEVNELELVSLKVDAKDPDDDSITYSYSDPLDDDGKWQTDQTSAGNYLIDVTVSDPELSTTSTVLLVVNNVNAAPQIVQYSPSDKNPVVQEGSSIKFKITASDIDNDDLAYVWLRNGNVVSTQSSYEYSPDYDSEGDHTIKGYAKDYEYESEPIVWDLTVNNKNRPPVIPEIDEIAVKENQNITLKVTATDPDNDKLTYTVSPPFIGNTWQPGYDDSGDHNVTVTVSDGDLTTIRTVIIHVINVDRAPTIKSYTPSDTSLRINETESILLSINASDLDGDKLTYLWESNQKEVSTDPTYLFETDYESAGKHTIVAKVSDGLKAVKLLWIVMVEDVNAPPKINMLNNIEIQETDLLSLKLNITDSDSEKVFFSVSEPLGNDLEWQPGYDDSDEYTITIIARDEVNVVEKNITLTVINKNRVPSIIGYTPDKEEVMVKENSTLLLKIVANDPDGDELSYMWSLDGAAVSTDKEYRYIPDFESSGPHEISVKVSDKELSAGNSWKIDVKNTNRAPVLDDFEDILVDETETVKINLKAYDPDNDDVYHQIGEPIGNDKEWKTTFDDAGEYFVNVTVTDLDLQTTKFVRVIVNDVDRPIEFVKPYKIKANENETIIFELNVSDPDNDPITITAKDMPPGAVLNGKTFEWYPGHDIVYRKHGFFRNLLYKMGYEAKEKFTITFTATSGNTSVRHKMKLIVYNVNRPPVLTDVPDQITVKETDNLAIPRWGTDPDRDPIKYKLSGWTKSVVSRTTFSDSGTFTVTMTASDGELSASKNITINILNNNRPPTLKNIKDKVTEETKPIKFKVDGSDPDDDPLYYYIEGMPDGAEFFDHTFNWTPGYDDAGIHEVEAKVTDGDYTASDEINITVINTNRKPEIVGYSPSIDSISTVRGSKVTFTVNAIDPDGDELTYYWYFGFFDNVEGKSGMRRLFQSTGSKKVTVIVSDGEDSVRHTWKVAVKDKPVIDKHTEYQSIYQQYVITHND